MLRTSIATVCVLLLCSGHASSQSVEKAQLVRACDQMAAAPHDVSRPAGVAGVPFVKIDAEAAIVACEGALAAFATDSRLKFELGRALHKGKRDLRRVVALYRDAAAQGYAAAINEIAHLYETGQGVPLDYAKAIEWYEKAATAGNALAINNLGVMYEKGRGVPRDVIRAHDQYLKAAAAGDAWGMFNLGGQYARGEAVPQSFATARDWHEKSAAAGNARAMNALGVIYDKGQGVAQNYVRAHDWFLRAAAAGEPWGMYNLGFHYASGRGVPQDLVVARAWYEKASAAGNAEAIKNLDALNRTQQSLPPVEKPIETAKKDLPSVASPAGDPISASDDIRARADSMEWGGLLAYCALALIILGYIVAVSAQGRSKRRIRI